MDSFEVGKTYKLMDDKVSRFYFTSDVRERLGIPENAKQSFTFTPERIDAHGDSYMGTTCVACYTERPFFELVEVNKPKVKKPFKVGATYRLKPEYINEFMYTSAIRSVYGNGVFSFTVSHINGEHVYASNVNTSSIAIHKERHMFTRIDNK